MTVEHLRCWTTPEIPGCYSGFVKNWCKGRSPIRFRVGRMTASRKPDGGVRGIVAGDVIRRLVARTIAQQLEKTVEAATPPHQHALSTRSGCECIAHSLQGMCEMDHTCTVLSNDGIGAFDRISRAAMLDGLLNVARARAGGLPFVLMFYAPSAYLWEDDARVIPSCGEETRPCLLKTGSEDIGGASWSAGVRATFLVIEVRGA